MEGLENVRLMWKSYGESRSIYDLHMVFHIDVLPARSLQEGIWGYMVYGSCPPASSNMASWGIPELNGGFMGKRIYKL